MSGTKFSRQLFEDAPRIFEIKRPDVTAKAEGRRVAEPEDRLKRKDEVIAELAEELLSLKKRVPAVDRLSKDEP
ncbi:MAG: hypothetical protein LBB48_10405 [Treponema sp.]|nr:hypothetical protein [Treponema sp.]